MSNSVEQPYARLSPDTVLSALESVGFVTDGRVLALNSYENRVYQVGLEEGAPLVAKFYRPGRWSTAQILEEHAFTLELAALEIPVVAPILSQGQTLHEHAGFRFSASPRRGGRWPELQDPQELEWMGRFIARLHAAGASRAFETRPALDVQSFGVESVDFLLGKGWLPAHVRDAYETLSEDLFDRIDAAIERAGEIALIRTHGDCHPGNILWTDDGPHFVDLDDCRTAPAVQDLWMLLSGSRGEMQAQLTHVLDGYMEFNDFNPRELHLVEALRTLRMQHYAAWLARRWADPAFPLAFPWFNTDRYWEEHILHLREQVAAMDEPPLSIQVARRR